MTNQQQPERPTCATCPYWEGLRRGSRGHCRKACPAARLESFGGDSVLVAAHPLTWPHEWCGEHPEFPAWLAAERSPQGSASRKAAASVDRRTKWAARVIAGESVTDIARSEGIRPPYVRDSIMRVFRRRNEKLYKSLIGQDYGTTRTPSMRSLVRHAEQFGFAERAATIPPEA